MLKLSCGNDCAQGLTDEKSVTQFTLYSYGMVLNTQRRKSSAMILCKMSREHLARGN